MQLSFQSWCASTLPGCSRFFQALPGSSLSLQFMCYPGYLSQAVCLVSLLSLLVSISVSFYLSPHFWTFNPLSFDINHNHLPVFHLQKQEVFLLLQCWYHSMVPWSSHSLSCILSPHLKTSSRFLCRPTLPVQFLWLLYLYLKGTWAWKLIWFFQPNYWSNERYFFFQTWSHFEIEGFLPGIN